MNEDKMRKDFEAWAKKRLGGHQWAKGHEWEAWQEASKTSGRPVAPAWQPVETMPNDDGSWIVADAKRGYVAPYIRGVIHNNPGSMWDWQYGEAITHYMPLPPAPEVKP